MGSGPIPPNMPRLTGRRRMLVLSAAACAVARPSGAVIVLDSTWRAEGGRPGRESRGFRAHIALANQPQFAGLVSFSNDDGEIWGAASGTWIGNDASGGYILTAGHNFDDGGVATDYVYRSQSGAVHQGVRLFMHPAYNGDVTDRTGYDIAVVRLSSPITDAGPPPLLYSGRDEMDARVVIVGFGNRGIGSKGEADEYHEPSDKAAAENQIDEVMDAGIADPCFGRCGQLATVTFRRGKPTWCDTP